jgi:5-methylcytosine-specific restriction protein A
MYAGTLMRSRLEASFAGFFNRLMPDLCLEYEPMCFAGPGGQYLPDFRFRAKRGWQYIEIKPDYESAIGALEQMEIILESEPDACLSVWMPDGWPDPKFSTVGIWYPGGPWRYPMTDRICIEPGCPLITSSTRCPAHERAYQQAREERPGRADRHDRTLKRIPSTGICHICGLPGADTRDHVLPLAAGGTNDPSNVLPAHRACNSRKGYRVEVDPEAYGRETR